MAAILARVVPVLLVISFSGLPHAKAAELGDFRVADIKDIMKKYGKGNQQDTGKSEERRVLATAGVWTLVYAHFWSSVAKKKVPACSAYTDAVDKTGSKDPVTVFFTRWQETPDLAEFSVVLNFNTTPDGEVVVATRRDPMRIEQGYAFLKRDGHEALAQALKHESRAELHFTPRDAKQSTSIVQEFSTDGFADIYDQLLTKCQPKEGFSGQ